MKTRLAQHPRRNGFSYVSVILTALVIGIAMASYLQLVASQNQMTMRSQAWNRSVPVLEAGVEEALAHLNKNAAADSSGIFNLNLDSDGWTAVAGGGWMKTNVVGEDYYEVTIGPFVAKTYYPQITSIGYVKQLPTFTSLGNGMFNPFLATIGLTAQQPSGYTRRMVVCNTTNVPLFTHGLIAKDKVDLNGKNVETDSFDSSNPLYSTGRQYDPTKRRNNGDIASNGTIEDSVDVGNAKVFGHVFTGPKGGLEIGAQGGVGEFSWVSANRGKVQPGWWRNDLNVDFPDVQLPALSSPTGPDRDREKDGVIYKYVFNDGDYVVDSYTTLSGKILVAGNARVVVHGNIQLTGSSDAIVIRTNASLMLWMNGPSAKIAGNGVVNPSGVATNFYYFGTPRHTALDLGGNAAMTMAIYAPNAFLQLNGGGTTTINDFCGAAVVKGAKFNGNFNFHFDEALPKMGLYRGYVLTSWNEK